MSIERLENESLRDYQIRLSRNKELYRLTWPMIASILNPLYGKDFTPSRYRKFWNSYSQGYDDAMRERLSGDEILEEVESKTREFEKKRIQFRDQRNEYMRVLREQARFEHLRDEIVSAVGELAKVKPLDWNTAPVHSPSPPHREATILFGDWHRGLFASNYWNTFNDVEFQRRIARYVTKSIQYSQMHNVKKLHVFLNGDLVHGLIHVTTRILATEDTIEQTQIVSETLANVLCKYANEFDEVKVYYTLGNHGRISANKKESLTGENFDLLVPWYLKARLAFIENIEFMSNTYDPEIADAIVCGKLCYSVHGDKDNASNVVQNLTLMTGKKPDYVFMSHIHKDFRDEVHGVKIITNPSLSGVDSYSKDIRKTSHPGQHLIIFDEHEGELCTYPIRLDIA